MIYRTTLQLFSLPKNFRGFLFLCNPVIPDHCPPGLAGVAAFALSLLLVLLARFDQVDRFGGF